MCLTCGMQRDGGCDSEWTGFLNLFLLVVGILTLQGTLCRQIGCFRNVSDCLFRLCYMRSDELPDPVATQLVRAA